MKKIGIFLFAISLVLNFLLGGAMLQNHNLPTAEAVREITNPGTYGPPAIEIIDDDVTISTADVTLQNTLITGNLYLDVGINEGTITLNQVEVQGEVIIAASRKIILQLVGCSVGKITVQEHGGAVNIITQGSTSVDNVDIAAETTLLENGLNDNAQGFKNVNIITDKRVLLFGNFNIVDTKAKAANVKVVKGSITTINITNTAANAELDLAKDVQVGSLVLDAVITLIGEGTIETVDLNIPGLIQLQGTLGDVTCQVEGIFLELRAGSIDKLLVPQLESATSITLAADTMIENMELNGRTGVTGQGQIGTVTINHSGVTIDQTPAKILLAEGLTAMINGEEYKIVPEPEPEPPKPTVSINIITNMTLLAGKAGTRDIVVSPSGAGLTVRSSNTSVATVSLSGKRITVTAKKSGTATITVTGSHNGYTSVTRTFKVTVNALTDVKTFEIKDGMSPGKKLVYVTLYDPDQSKYIGKVKISGVVLEYLSEFKRFYGEVNTSDAKIENVKVE